MIPASIATQALSSSQALDTVRRTMRLGELLVAAGKMSQAQVDSVLAMQMSDEARFGELAVKAGYVKRLDVDRALAIQYGYASGEPTTAIPAGLTAATRPGAPFAEAIRSLRSQLMMRWFDGTPGQTSLAITSVDRSDGKSFVTANLGVVFSQLGERTLIIDCDLRHSSQHKLFNLRNRMGLSGILSGRSGLEEMIEIPNVANLVVLPAGPQPPNPLELLSRDGFSMMLNELSSQFDVILLDTPSAQQAADAQVIAQRARAAMVVSRKGRNKSSEVSQLVSILSGAGVTMLGAMLNEY